MDIDFKYGIKKIIPKQYYVNEHTHPCYELVYYINGYGDGIINKKSYSYVPNSYVIINPNIIHSETGFNNEIMYIGFDIKNKNFNITDTFSIEENDVIKNLMLMIIKELSNNSVYSNQIIEVLCETIVFKLLQKQDDGTVLDQDYQIKKAINYIKNNCMQNINTSTIVDISGYSYDHFRKIFKEMIGMSIKDFILQQKMKNILELLKTPEYSINRIAKISGFSSTSHFCMTFKKYYNINPIQFRKNPNIIYKELYDYDLK